MIFCKSIRCKPLATCLYFIKHCIDTLFFIPKNLIYEKSNNFHWGGNYYLAPQITVATIAIERGFEASLPGLDVEEGESWLIY